jgi:hypothetical protein
MPHRFSRPRRSFVSVLFIILVFSLPAKATAARAFSSSMLVLRRMERSASDSIEL